MISVGGGADAATARLSQGTPVAAAVVLVVTAAVVGGTVGR